MIYLRFLHGLFIACMLLCTHPASARDNSGRLSETHWQYTYTLQLETNSLVQQAGDQWQHFLYFRFDSVCRQQLNGKVTESDWWLDSQELHFAFRQQRLFSLSRLNDYSLELTYVSKDGKSTYVHHFARIQRENSPLGQETNTLPVVLVQTIPLPQADPEVTAQAITLPAPGTEPASVELVGGGYYGGINPVQQDFITISGEGRLIHQFESMQGKRLTQKTDIPKEELDRFIEWATKEQRFMEMESSYDCKTPECEKRKTVKPTPVPLRLSISTGEVRKMVTVSIWGLDKNGRRYVSYPPELDRIIDAVQRLASRNSAMK